MHQPPADTYKVGMSSIHRKVVHRLDGFSEGSTFYRTKLTCCILDQITNFKLTGSNPLPLRDIEGVI